MAIGLCVGRRFRKGSRPQATGLGLNDKIDGKLLKKCAVFSGENGDSSCLAMLACRNDKRCGMMGLSASSCSSSKVA